MYFALRQDGLSARQWAINSSKQNSTKRFTRFLAAVTLTSIAVLVSGLPNPTVAQDVAANRKALEVKSGNINSIDGTGNMVQHRGTVINHKPMIGNVPFRNPLLSQSLILPDFKKDTANWNEVDDPILRSMMERDSTRNSSRSRHKGTKPHGDI